MNKLLLCTFIFVTACGHLTIERAEDVRAAEGPYLYNLDSWLFGIIAPHHPETEQTFCPSSTIERIDMEANGQDVVISVITLGIYVPHRITVTCAANQVHPVK